MKSNVHFLGNDSNSDFIECSKGDRENCKTYGSCLFARFGTRDR